MSKIPILVGASSGMAELVRGYVGHLTMLLRTLDVEALSSIAADLEDARKSDRTIFIAGNGGSAATATHMVNDLVFGTRSEDNRATIRAVSLTDSPSLVTAIANDTGYAEVFVQQLRSAFRPGDRLVVITASGNSPNILAAAKWVKENGGRVLGLLGFDGGAVKPLCDVSLHVVTGWGEYGPVEDVHLIVNHLLTTWLRLRITGNCA